MSVLYQHVACEKFENRNTDGSFLFCFSWLPIVYLTDDNYNTRTPESQNGQTDRTQAVVLGLSPYKLSVAMWTCGAAVLPFHQIDVWLQQGAFEDMLLGCFLEKWTSFLEYKCIIEALQPDFAIFWVA